MHRKTLHKYLIDSRSEKDSKIQLFTVKQQGDSESTINKYSNLIQEALGENIIKYGYLE
jgi:hypothetical protein